MTPDALSSLAATVEGSAPGLAFVLREWSTCVRHGDVLAVAKESLHALAGARRLAAICPDDGDHRTAVAVLEGVFDRAARAVFRRDAEAWRSAHVHVPAR